MDTNEIIADAYERLAQENRNLRETLRGFRDDDMAEQIKALGEKLNAVDGAQAKPAEAADDECDCPICQIRREIEKAEAAGKAKVGKQPHPWDWEVEPSSENPLGSSANQMIASLRAKNKELSAINDGLRGDLAGKIAEQVGEIKRQIEATQLRRRLDGVSVLGSTSLTVDYQHAVAETVRRLWGSEAMFSLDERVQRFLEEAIELAQACKFDPIKIGPIISWVYSRPKGPIGREIGGTMVTLAGLCERLGQHLPMMALDELRRLERKTPEEMRERHNAKPDAIRSTRV